MTDSTAQETPVVSATTLKTRGYQQEMLEESLKRNIIIALDTGSGKTHIAVLRMKLEAEREPVKVSWFMAPTVALCEQQKEVIATAIPVPVGLITGALEPKQWTDPALWRRVLNTYRIMVTTPQVLLDALSHGYVQLGRDIGLLVFDEAHHGADKHPYNLIMKEFYLHLPRRGLSPGSVGVGPIVERPHILGLTASPIFGGQVEIAFRIIESNLDSLILAPQRYRDELAMFVHRPVFKHILYPQPDYLNPAYSPNLAALQLVIGSMDIQNDPYVQSLRQQLQNLNPGSKEWLRVDQKLSKTIRNNSSYTHKGLRDLERGADEICRDIGPWAADWYIAKVVEQALASASPYQNIISAWQSREKTYLLNILSQIEITPVSYDPEVIIAETSDKVQALIECLEAERMTTESNDEPYSGLIFVTRRDAVLSLAEVLTFHPRTAHIFQVGCLLGSSGSPYRNTFLDITRQLLRQSPTDTLTDFRIGDKTLLVATSVAEEGLDISLCGSVIRWDPPSNMVSWAQSRGRARRKRSTFVLMFERNPLGPVHQTTVSQWERLEKEMMDLYNDTQRALRSSVNGDDDTTLVEEERREFYISSTGALLTLDSVVAHLSHFCAVMPHAMHIDHSPIYDIDPSDLPVGWHSFDNRSRNLTPYKGPFGCTLTLPRLLPPHLRVFSVERKYNNKRSAHRNAAFDAYLALYKAELLNEHLLPLSSVIEPDLEEEVKDLLKDVEKRAGTASVSVQMDPWATADGHDLWYSTELVIDGLPALLMITRCQPGLLQDAELPVLQIPNRDPITFRTRPLGTFNTSAGHIEEARRYTRQMFWATCQPRMSWEGLDFIYLFLPTVHTNEEKWTARRLWANEKNIQSGRSRPGAEFFANAEAFGQEFSYPDDLTFVRNGDSSARVFRFVRWQFNTITAEEEEELRERYKKRYPNCTFEISYPLLLVEAVPKRMSLLSPLPSRMTTSPPKTLLLVPNYATVDLVSADDTAYATFLPSILRFIGMAMTVISLRDTLLSPSPLSMLPLELLTMAITAPVSQELVNYQRLETLGDTVLKFTAGIQLLSEHPFWHEGYLSRKKDHAVANVRLAKEAIAKQLYRWIIRDRLVARKWKPMYTSNSSDIEVDRTSTTTLPEKSQKGKANQQQLSTKVLADVVESLIGAAYLHGGFDLAVDCGQMFGLGLPWQKLPVRIEAMLSTIQRPDGFPSQITDVERMLGYNFVHKLLLVEALTHASHQQDLHTMSYERMEFLGDSVLDMIVTDYLYRAPGKNYSPGHIHLRKSAVVNGHFLAFICLRCSLSVDASMPRPDIRNRITVVSQSQKVFLWQCLLHSSHRILDDQKFTFARYERAEANIEHILQNGSIFPWAALTRLQAPKFFSDVVESLLGAVYLDSGGNIDVVREVLRKLGILQVLERIVRDDVDVLHPVSRMSVWAAKQKKKIEYSYERSKGKIICSVLIDGEEVVKAEDLYRGKASQQEVRFLAAEMAIQALDARKY